MRNPCDDGVRTTGTIGVIVTSRKQKFLSDVLTRFAITQPDPMMNTVMTNITPHLQNDDLFEPLILETCDALKNIVFRASGSEEKHVVLILFCIVPLCF